MISFEKLSSDDRIKIYSLLFLILSLPYIYFVIWRVGIPFEINGNEPWNAYHARNAFNPSLLYPDTSQYINNYPPLSYYLIHLLSFSGLNEIIIGRTLSLFSILILSLTIYFTGRHLVPESYGGPLFGALWFLVTMCRGFVGYAGMNDPHLLGLSVMAIGFLIFLKFQNSKLIYLAFFIMIIAGFIKNSLLALPLASVFLLFAEKNKHLTKIFLFSLIILVLFFGLFTYLYGENFINQLFIPREIKPERIIHSAQRLQWVIIPISCWIFWMLSEKNRNHRLVTSVLIGFSSMIFFGTVIAEGVGTNAIFELVFSCAICMSIFLPTFAQKTIRTFSVSTIIIILCLLRTILTLHNDPYLLLVSSSYREDISHRIQIFDTAVNSIRESDQAIKCSNDTVCFYAGKDRAYGGAIIELPPELKWTIRQ